MITVILDGNNVLQARGLHRLQSAAGAEQFFQRLEMAAVSRDWEAIAIFDGPERFLPRESGPLVIRHAKPGTTADSLIERLVYQAADRTQIVVVTRDRAEANLVLGLGARVWNIDRLIEEMG